MEGTKNRVETCENWVPSTQEFADQLDSGLLQRAEGRGMDNLKCGILLGLKTTGLYLCILCKIYILLTSNLGLVGHTRQFQKPMSSRLIQHWHFLLRPMSSGHNHDIHRNMYEVFKEAAPAKTHSRTLCHHCVTRVPGSGI